MRVLALVLLLTVTPSSFADEKAVLATGDWSKATNGIRGRLILAQGRTLGDGKARESLFYVELENVENTSSGVVNVYFDPDALKCELTDADGKAVPRAPVAGSGGRPAKAWVAIPFDSSVRLRANPYAFGRAEGLLIHLCTASWHIKDDAEYHLSGILTVSPPDGHGRADAWKGALKLPPMKVRAPAPVPATKIEFEEVTIIVKPGGPTDRAPETIRVSADGKCLYEVPARPARGETPAWSGARIVHTLPSARLRELNDLLKGTDWFERDATRVMQLHQDEYKLALKRGGKTIDRTMLGELEPYTKLLHYFRSVAAQEYLLYRLEHVPAAQVEARRELDNLVAAELGEPFAKSPLDIDLARYSPWATRLVRRPFEQSTDDVRAAVRLVGLLKLESEREYLSDLAADRDRGVRTAVAVAVGRLGGEKAGPVLRKLVRSTGAEAAWELIRLGPVAAPVIAEVIRDGAGEEDLSYEWLIRAYIDHWKDVPKPLDAKIVEAVQVSMAVPKVKAYRTEYHEQLLKLIAVENKKE